MTPNELAEYQVREIADAVIKLGLSGGEKELFVREAARLFRYQNDIYRRAGRAFDEAYDRAQAFLETGKMTGVA